MVKSTKQDPSSCAVEPQALPSTGAERPERSTDAQATMVQPDIDDRGGGRPSNTHPHSSHVLINRYPDLRAAGGFDWFEWSTGIQWISERFQQLVAVLRQIKERLQASSKPDEFIELWEVGPVRVHRTGFNRGGGKGQHFEFKLSCDGVTLGLSGDANPTGTAPNLVVKQTGRECLLIGAEQHHERMREVIAALGGVIKWEKLSRADLTLDVVNLDVSRLQQLVERGQFVTRAKKVSSRQNLVTGEQTGFEVGAKPSRLIVYDKLKELLGKADYLYWRAMVERRWGGGFPSSATRVEFQVSREWLLKRGVDTPADLFELQGSLIKKLMFDWFRVTTAPVDRDNKNQSRAETHPLWLGLASAFEQVYGSATGELYPVLRDKIHPMRLIKQARGCLASALLQRGASLPSYSDFVAAAARLLLETADSAEEKLHEQRIFMLNYQRRRTEHAA